MIALLLALASAPSIPTPPADNLTAFWIMAFMGGLLVGYAIGLAVGRSSA